MEIPCRVHESRFLRLRNGRSWLAVGEALLWMLGYLAGQAVVLGMLMVLLLVAAFGWSWPTTDSLLWLVLELDLDRSFMLVGATSLGVLFVMVPLVRLREGPDFRNRIGWRSPRREQIVFSLATVVPIAFLGDVVYDAARSVWTESAGVTPFAAALRETSLEHLYHTFQGVSFPVLVVALALGPAIGEEMIFRGVIGRRLVGSLGMVRGVALTSVLFALAHGSVPHALATLPVAVLLHWLYLQTGTIWIPVLVHCCNNLLALTFVRFSITTAAAVSPFVVLTMSLYLVSILWLLHSRGREAAVSL